MTKEDHPRTRQNDVMPPAVKMGQQPVENLQAQRRPASPQNHWITRPIWTIMDR